MQQPSATLASTITDTHTGNENATSNPNVDVEKAASTERTDPNSEPPSRLSHIRKSVLTISFIGLLSPLSASIYFPAIGTLANDLHVSVTDINLTVTTYLVSRCLILSRKIRTLTLYCRSSKLLAQPSLATYPTSKAEDQPTLVVLLSPSQPMLPWLVKDHMLLFWSSVAFKALVRQLLLLWVKLLSLMSLQERNEVNGLLMQVW